jgi:hypothetical protein
MPLTGLPPIQGPPYLPAAIPIIKSPVGVAASPGSQSSTARSYDTNTPTMSAAQIHSWASPSASSYTGGTSGQLGGEPYQPGDEANSVGFVLDRSNTKYVRVPHSFDQQDQSPHGFNHVPPVHTILPRIFAACPLDNLMLSYLHGSQRSVARGRSLPVLDAGPAHPSFNVLVAGQSNYVAHPLSTLFTDILKTFPDITELPDKVAIVYIMFLIMRWQVHPTLENYLCLPEWATPRPPQLLIPHPHWLDHIPW